MVRRSRLIQNFVEDGSVLSKKEFVKSRFRCQMCSLWDSCRRPLILDKKDNIVKIKYMFVGEAPGNHEDIKGLPFVGRSGQLLHDCLEDVGFNSEEVYFTNVIKCRPPKNGTPTDRQVDSCIDFLINEILLLQPEFIILLGSVASKTFGFSKAISILRGSIFSGNEIGYKKEALIFCLFHPAYILRNMDTLEDFISDLRMVKNYDPRSIKLIETTFYFDDYGHLDLDSDIYKWILPELMNSKVIALDIETDGYEFPVKVLSYAISNGKNSICFEWTRSSISILEEIFKSAEVLLAHNWVFEYKAFVQEGLDCTGILDKMRDTMLMSALLNENRTHGLKALAYLVNFGGYESRLLPCHISKLSEYKIEQWYKYNCADTYVTYKLYEMMLPEIKDLKLEYLLKQWSKYQAVVADLELTGVRVDIKLLQTYSKDIVIDIESLNVEMCNISAVNEMQKETGKKINFNSSQQLVKLINIYMKIQLHTKTKGGNSYSMDAKVIQSLAREHTNAKFFRLLLIYKKLKKLQSTYLEGFERYINADTKRIYPSYNLLGTVTGRSASYDPNIQNIPRDHATNKALPPELACLSFY